MSIDQQEVDKLITQDFGITSRGNLSSLKQDDTTNIFQFDRPHLDGIAQSPDLQKKGYFNFKTATSNVSDDPNVIPERPTIEENSMCEGLIKQGESSAFRSEEKKQEESSPTKSGFLSNIFKSLFSNRGSTSNLSTEPLITNTQQSDRNETSKNNARPSDVIWNEKSLNNLEDGNASIPWGKYLSSRESIGQANRKPTRDSLFCGICTSRKQEK